MDLFGTRHRHLDDRNVSWAGVEKGAAELYSRACCICRQVCAGGVCPKAIPKLGAHPWLPGLQAHSVLPVPTSVPPSPRCGS